MKRRTFIHTGAAGVLSAGAAGCGVFGAKKYVISEPENTPMELSTTIPKPTGTMPANELGGTGIRVSKFGFGSHMRPDMIKYEQLRERMIREGHEMGINLYDVYDIEHTVYQYEPMGRFLKPIVHDVVISIALLPYDGRTLEQEFERDLRLFGKDCIDLVRCHAWKKSDDPAVLRSQANQTWNWWDFLFKMKEQGKIRAVGVPIHRPGDLEDPLRELPIDYVFLPYNFYHNWYGQEPHDFDALITNLKDRGIGVITMKPQLGDRLAKPFRDIAAKLPDGEGIDLAKTNLKYIINSPLYPTINSTICGMFNPEHLYDNVDAFYHPAMSDQERRLLSRLRKVAKVDGVTERLLPDHYKFLEEWAPPDWDDASDLFHRA